MTVQAEQKKALFCVKDSYCEIRKSWKIELFLLFLFSVTNGT